MRRTNWKQPLVILAAFIIGLIVNLLARQILPKILPESLAKGSDLIAVILQILVAAGIIFITVRVFFREED
jgi:type III secretory pathway component EscS